MWRLYRSRIPALNTIHIPSSVVNVSCNAVVSESKGAATVVASVQIMETSYYNASICYPHV